MTYGVQEGILDTHDALWDSSWLVLPIIFLLRFRSGEKAKGRPRG